MRGVGQEAISLHERLPDESDFSVFEVTNTTVDHVRRRRRSSRTKVVLLDKYDLDSLQGEVAEGGNAVDATTNDENLSLGIIGDVGDSRRGSRSV